MKGVVLIVTILESFNILNPKTVSVNDSSIHHKLGENILRENYKSWLPRIRLKKRLRENENIDYEIPFLDSPLQNAPSQFEESRDKSIYKESKNWWNEEELRIDPHVSLIHGTLVKTLEKLPNENSIPPEVKRSKGNIIENDLQKTRAVYNPSKVLSKLSDLPRVVRGKIIGGKPSTVVVLKSSQSGTTKGASQMNIRSKANENLTLEKEESERKNFQPNGFRIITANEGFRSIRENGNNPATVNIDDRLRDLSSTEVMRTNGWNIDAKGFGRENRFRKYCGGGANAWYGNKPGRKVGFLQAKFQSTGKAKLSYGNCYHSGAVIVYLNNQEISRASPKSNEVVSFDYKKNDVLRITETIGVIKLDSLELIPLKIENEGTSSIKENVPQETETEKTSTTSSSTTTSSTTTNTSTNKSTPGGTAAPSGINDEPRNEQVNKELQNTGSDCWYRCNSRQGPCAWCGIKGMCCKIGWNDKSNGCDGTFGGTSRHECALPPDDSFQYKCELGFCFNDGETYYETLEKVVVKACSMDHPKCKAYSYSASKRRGHLCSTATNLMNYHDFQICKKIENDITETVEDRCNDYINIYDMKKLCRHEKYKNFRLFAQDDIFKKERKHLNPRRKYSLDYECKDSCNAVRNGWSLNKYGMVYIDQHEAYVEKKELETYCPKVRITGGREVEKHTYPWQVGLVDKMGARPKCGGMIINRQVVLTAAHCVDFEMVEKNSYPSIPWYVVTKKHDFSNSETGDHHKICKVLLHENWNWRGTGKMDYDFALLYLKRPMDFDYKARPVCLADASSLLTNPDHLIGKTLQVSGWGRTNSNDHYSVADKLMAVNVSVISNSDCGGMYTDFYSETGTKITDRMLCAGDQSGRGKDSCKGDSGGPLTYMERGIPYAIGVVSFGSQDCGNKDKLGVYGRVSSVLSWIKKNMNKRYKC